MLTQPNPIGVQLRSLRMAQGKSQVEIAKVAGISRTTLVQIEKGLDAQITSYQAVAQALGVALGLGRDSPELAARLQARQENQAKLALSREKHLKIATLMALGGKTAQELKFNALKMVALWREKDLCSPIYIERWLHILEAEPKEIAQRILGMDEAWAPALRQNTPFALTRP